LSASGSRGGDGGACWFYLWLMALAFCALSLLGAIGIAGLLGLVLDFETPECAHAGRCCLAPCLSVRARARERERERAFCAHVAQHKRPLGGNNQGGTSSSCA
jgi:hypothetical protein